MKTHNNIKNIIITITLLHASMCFLPLNSTFLTFNDILFGFTSLTLNNNNYISGKTDWYEDSVTKLLRINITYPHTDPNDHFSVSYLETLNLFTYSLYAPSQTNLPKPFITFDMVNNISNRSNYDSFFIQIFYPFSTDNSIGTPLSLFHQYQNLFLGESTNYFHWMMFAHYLVYFSKYIEKYTLLGISNNPTTSFSFTIPQFSNSPISTIGNSADTYNNLTITINTSHDLPLAPLLTFTFNQILKTQTITTSYTIEAHKLLNVNTFLQDPSFQSNSTGHKLNDYLTAFITATSEPYLAYYSLMWFVASLSKKYPGNNITNANEAVTIDMVGYNKTAYITAIAQLTTNPNDLAGNTVPFKPLIRVPLVTHRTTRATQYVTAAIPFDITNTPNLIFLNDLLINYIGQNAPQDVHYYALLAQLNPTTPTVIQNNLPAPYTTSFSVQGTVVTGTGDIPIYFQLAYIINDTIQPAPFIQVDIPN